MLMQFKIGSMLYIRLHSLLYFDVTMVITVSVII